MNPSKGKGALRDAPNPKLTTKVKLHSGDFRQTPHDKLLNFQRVLRRLVRWQEKSFWAIAQLLARVDDEIERRAQ